MENKEKEETQRAAFREELMHSGLVLTETEIDVAEKWLDCLEGRVD